MRWSKPISMNMAAVRLGKPWAVELQVLAPSISQCETPIEAVRKLAAAIEFEPGEDYGDAGVGTPGSWSSMTDVIGGPHLRYFDYGAELQRQRSWDTVKTYLLRYSPLLLIVVIAIARAIRRRNA
ncbi:hypothetical protein [Pseudomonas sp. MF4836]|uniref:hypothetical protein n=2 Tax=Pseudomonas TaxID=286 RepID=UPI000998C037|nr:hypothetical protein [Pseudomonas sp. MF4836]OOW00816.1 hypothetical protein MF4836_02585 [Pseudomonas sp. MF4836]